MIRYATIIGLMFILLLANIVIASDVIELNPKYNHSLFIDRDRIIDPDGSVYGIKFGATEKQVLEAFGVPNGVFVLNESKKVFLYGKSHLFIFRNGKFCELRVGEYVFNWDLLKQMEGHPFFDRNDWTLKPGLKDGMDFEEVKKVLGKPNVSPDYKFTFDTKNASITLDFSSMSVNSWFKSTSFRLLGFTIVSFEQ
jgi:hypothetical protein